MNMLVSQRLAEGFGDTGGPTFYPWPEITAALNESYRLFVLLTLGLETTVSWIVPPATTFFHMLTAYPDWIAPLRIASDTRAKVRPARPADLWSLDSAWVASPGSPVRYAHQGADLLALYRQPAAATVLTVTYAQSPAWLVEATDSPAVPQEWHPLFPKYAIYRCRQVEGGAEFAGTLPLLEEFLAGAEKYGNIVRARNVGSAYDTLPMELSSFDRSRLVGLAKK